jgi:hypothetical protein
MMVSPVRRRGAVRNIEAVPAQGNWRTIRKQEHLHGVFRSPAKDPQNANHSREHWSSLASACLAEPLAGRPTVAGCALPGTAKNLQLRYQFATLAVRQHPVNVPGVGVMDQLQFLQAAHAIGPLGAEQVPLSGMHAQDFSGRRNFEALGGAAMRLEFKLLYLFGHEHYLSEFL